MQTVCKLFQGLGSKIKPPRTSCVQVQNVCTHLVVCIKGGRRGSIHRSDTSLDLENLIRKWLRAKFSYKGGSTQEAYNKLEFASRSVHGVG